MSAMVGTATWLPLAPSDPVPGDPVELRVVAARSAAAAEEAGRQAAAVRRVLAGPGWDGPAAEAFRCRLRGLPADLDAVAERCQRTAVALRDLAPTLEGAQARARSALAAAHEAQQRAGVRPGSAPDPLPVFLPDTGDPVRRAMVDEVARAQRALAAACADRDRAAARCARALRAAADDRLRNPHGWHRILEVVSRVAGQLSTWLGVAAVCLAIVPGVGEMVGALALTAGVVALASDLALTRYGEAGWPAVLGDVVGVIPAGRMMRGAIAVPAGVTTVRALTRAGRPQVVRDVVHGVAAVREARGAAAAARPGGSAAAWRAFLHSPGGVLHEVLSVERTHGRRGLDLLMGSYNVDLAHASIGVGQQLTPGRPRRRP